MIDENLIIEVSLYIGVLVMMFAVSANKLNN